MGKALRLLALLAFASVFFAGCGGKKTPHNDNPKTATPVFSPSGSQISNNAEVSISSSGASAIYYTTDGSNPGTGSEKYSGPFKLTEGSYVLKAIAVSEDLLSSDIAVKKYVVINGVVSPTVSASPAAGSYASAQSVTLSSSNSADDTIYYTTDGQDPEEGAANTRIYSSAISVEDSMTIRAFAKRTDGVAGNIAVFAYSIDPVVVPSPVIGPSSDSITVSDDVTISASLGTITYTIDSSDFANAASYAGPFKLSSGTHVVRAIATNDGIQSSVAMKSFVVRAVDSEKVETPVISILGTAPYHASTGVQISCATSGASISYSVDGGSYKSYSAAITLAEGYHKILAKATKSGMRNSSVTSATMDVVPALTAIRIYYKGTSAPKIWVWETSPDYATSEKMGYSWSTRPNMTSLLGASGWYYFDVPSTYRGTGTVHVKFGDTEYTVSSDKCWMKDGSWYATNPDVAVIPVISASPIAGSYRLSQNVVLTGSNTDDVIYYTTDGTEPTTSSSRYGSAIAVSTVKTIKAFGVNSDGISGDVCSFAYIIDPTIDDIAPAITASTEPGWYKSAISVTFTVSDNNSASTRAYYTTDGKAPTESSEEYLSGDVSSGRAGESFDIEMNETVNFRFLVVDAAGNKTEKSFYYKVSNDTRDDFRKESIYFVMTTRFYDGDSSNNFNCWGESELGNPASDPAWRGDFKGLVDKLDYIKALGFTAIWVTPPVKNASGLDYHGYHSVDFKKIDPRYKTSGDTSADEAYQKFIDACHAKGMKVVQDIVLNHSSNFGEENLFPLYEKDSDGGYKNISRAESLIPNAALLAAAQRLATKQGQTLEYILANQAYPARLEALKTDIGDPDHLYKHCTQTVYNSWLQQEGDMAGDCRELNTENYTTAKYLQDAYDHYINMGVDAFRIDTVKHIARVTFNNYFLPHFRQTGGENFFMFGECANIYSSVWDNDIPVQSTPFYTWKESKIYPWSNTPSEWTINSQSTADQWDDNKTNTGQPSSTNHYLSGNTYHAPDYSKRSGFGMIDFCMHHNFGNAAAAFDIKKYDDTYNDATWNVVYVDSHDYGPNNTGGLEKRFDGDQATLAENMTLMFTFRGIPTLYYGTEIQFQKGSQIDASGRSKIPFAQSGRAYYGANIEGSVTASSFGSYDSASGAVKATLDHPLAKHIARLNQIRRAVPALQRGQYSTDGITASGTAAFKRRYTNAAESIDSFVLVTISGSATFSGIPNGTYTDAVTGSTYSVTGGSLTVSCSGTANARILVLSSSVGKVGTAGTYLN